MKEKIRECVNKNTRRETYARNDEFGYECIDRTCLLVSVEALTDQLLALFEPEGLLTEKEDAHFELMEYLRGYVHQMVDKNPDGNFTVGDMYDLVCTVGKESTMPENYMPQVVAHAKQEGYQEAIEWVRGMVEINEKKLRYAAMAVDDISRQVKNFDLSKPLNNAFHDICEVGEQIRTLKAEMEGK